jgi:hypothetical protein
MEAATMDIHNPEDFISQVFTYHAPTEDQIPKYEALRAAARQFAYAIFDNVPQCSDRTAAFRHLRECVMTANSAISLNGSI